MPLGTHRTHLPAVILAVVLAPSSVLAAEVEGDAGFLSGLLHPLLGFDHLLAMLAVGLLSVQIGGRAVWSVPLAFLVFLAAGGGLGLLGVPLPQVEGAIALSVFGLGLAIALNATIAVTLAMLMVGFFAIFHGHAHGMEIPSLAEPALYVGGFLTASAVLHLAGVALGVLQRHEVARAKVGAGLCGIGLYMVLLTYSIV
ncbi:MAG: HupE/UreJ family protein [Pseudomonadota bacterium]